ncbi:MAG: hypothetical protein M1343_01695 [Chloroflexi bacterium]|nr:hypothetical protein [Chloroflexota bacterium]MDA8188427.1 hypothetical protein [Dehalococcoidales bacterium]
MNGVAPTVQNVLAGRYPMVRDLGIVWRDDASADTKQFIEFAFSKEGAAELMRSGFVPLAGNE